MPAKCKQPFPSDVMELIKEKANLKYCSSCNSMKSLDDFYNHKRHKDGKQTNCKECSKKAAYEWQERNYDKYREIVEEWRQNNADHVRNLQKIRYHLNPIPHRIAARRNYYKHQAKHNFLMNKERARKLGSVCELTPAEETYLISIYQLALDTTRKMKTRYVVDHIKPLKDGGLHHPDNVQVITHSENLRRANDPNYVCHPVPLPSVN